jgi:hypothetical protein
MRVISVNLTQSFTDIIWVVLINSGQILSGLVQNINFYISDLISYIVVK